jgi:hypothetical protein
LGPEFLVGSHRMSENSGVGTHRFHCIYLSLIHPNRYWGNTALVWQSIEEKNRIFRIAITLDLPLYRSSIQNTTSSVKWGKNPFCGARQITYIFCLSTYVVVCGPLLGNILQPYPLCPLLSTNYCLLILCCQDRVYLWSTD